MGLASKISELSEKHIIVGLPLGLVKLAFTATVGFTAVIFMFGVIPSLIVVPPLLLLDYLDLTPISSSPFTPFYVTMFKWIFNIMILLFIWAIEGTILVEIYLRIKGEGSAIADLARYISSFRSRQKNNHES